MKTLICGALAILAACWFWLSLVKNPFDELALIRRAQIAPGSLIDTHEIEQENSSGHVNLSDAGVYAYRLSDGREFKATTKAPTGQLKEHREIEYLSDNPAVSRVKGDGCRSITEWLWRKALLGTLLLVIFVSPGIVLLRHAILELKRKPMTTAPN